MLSLVCTREHRRDQKQLALDSVDAAATGEKADDKLVAATSGVINNVVTTLNKSALFPSSKYWSEPSFRKLDVIIVIPNQLVQQR